MKNIFMRWVPIILLILFSLDVAVACSVDGTPSCDAGEVFDTTYCGCMPIQRTFFTDIIFLGKMFSRGRDVKSMMIVAFLLVFSIAMLIRFLVYIKSSRKK